MVGWLERHAQAIQAAGALVMSAAALAAAIFVPWQIAANDRTSREQAAREIYREFLNISIQRPELAAQDVCTLTDPAKRAAYENYVDYLLYTAEQVMELNPSDWETDITARLRLHTRYLCTFAPADLEAMTPAVASLVQGLTLACDSSMTCPRAQP
ncbi:hypothetical protein SAMN05443432_11341 [Roseovarius litoreus]|uniref:Uncharacterized protein n=1 Tax=Roseovarius litoreus TaxID=1155722 RepID=A0A1M7L6A1_9RHOB|nr:hypothetical protein [Roseovarius litoreus]SHM73377.1 hypothetical protein SAMN05443432_11341 [Roseovarius litoreus]